MSDTRPHDGMLYDPTKVKATEIQKLQNWPF